MNVASSACICRDIAASFAPPVFARCGSSVALGIRSSWSILASRQRRASRCATWCEAMQVSSLSNDAAPSARARSSSVASRSVSRFEYTKSAARPRASNDRDDAGRAHVPTFWRCRRARARRSCSRSGSSSTSSSSAITLIGGRRRRIGVQPAAKRGAQQLARLARSLDEQRPLASGLSRAELLRLSRFRGATRPPRRESSAARRATGAASPRGNTCPSSR